MLSTLIGEGLCVAMQERRRLTRNIVRKHAKVLINNQLSALNCLVRDLTSDGAGLLVDAIPQPLDRIELSFDHFRTTHFCRVIWSQDNRLGVRFLPTLTQRAAPAAL